METALSASSGPQTNGASQDGRPHVVIIGAGFAGINAAKQLKGAPAQVTLVDRNNYHKFQPLLYEVAMAGLEPNDIAHNVRHILHACDNAQFRMGTVCNIDPAAQKILLRDGDVIPYDYLIIATGAVTNYFGVEGAAEHAFPLKNIPDAVNLRNHVLRQFEEVSRAPDEASPGALNFAIVGGGPTGVETAGAFVELFDTLDRDFPALDIPQLASVFLLEMEPDLLPPYASPLQSYTREVLEARGVNVMTETTVERVTSDAVHLANGRCLPTQTLIWAAGVKASPVVDYLGVEQTRAGRVLVDEDLSIPEHPNVYTVGDSAAVRAPDGSVHPQLAQVAIQTGCHAARNIRGQIEGNASTKPFQYRDYGKMATIGRNAAVAELTGGIQFKGFFAWFLWVFIHIAKLVGFRNRMTTFVNWIYNYFTYDRSARLILDVVSLDEKAPAEKDDVRREIETPVGN